MLEGHSGEEGNGDETMWKMLENAAVLVVLGMTSTGLHLTEEWGLPTAP